VKGSEEQKRLIAWRKQHEILVTPSVAWYEFRCGPVSSVEIDTIQLFLASILPFTELEAEIAGRLFGQAGRKRSLKTDAMIAATAITARAALATNNIEDFQKFPGLNLL